MLRKVSQMADYHNSLMAELLNDLKVWAEDFTGKSTGIEDFGIHGDWYYNVASEKYNKLLRFFKEEIGYTGIAVEVGDYEDLRYSNITHFINTLVFHQVLKDPTYEVPESVGGPVVTPVIIVGPNIWSNINEW